MKTYRSDVSVARSPDDVFPYLIEPAKQALWSDVPMRRLDEGQLKAGSRFEVTFGMGPLKATVGLEVTAVDPARRLAWKSYSGPIGWQGEYVLEPEGSGGTRLGQEGSLTFHGLWRLIEPSLERRSAVAKPGSLRPLRPWWRTAGPSRGAATRGRANSRHDRLEPRSARPEPRCSCAGG